MAAKQLERLTEGTRIKTTEPNMSLRREWTEAGWKSKRWGVTGTIVDHHDSHGLSYEVLHDDDKKIGHYDPSEVETI